ncbi:MAG: TolC family protein [Rhizobiales bacterium]|nr:TolC family protein [Hyphomicrobiales bacterium]
MMTTFFLRLALLSVLLLPVLGGCVTDAGVTPMSVAKAIPAASSAVIVPAAAPVLIAPKEPTSIVRLRDALALALLQNPELSTATYDIRAAEARIIQAGLIPNPEITGEVEDFGGTGERRGFNTTQSTLSLAQLIELGAKRTKRIRLAQVDQTLAGWDYEAKRLDILVDTVRAFVDVLATQRKVALAESLLELDQRLYGTVAERVKAGRASPLEDQRAQVVVANSRIALTRERSELQAAKQRLSAMWGTTNPRFTRAVGDLEDAGPIMPLPQLLSFAAQNPDLARWSAEIIQRQARLSVERSRAVPDPRVTAGVRRYNDRNDTAFLAGVSVPIPIYGLNTGNIREAEKLLEKGQEQKRAANLRVDLGISQAYQKLSAAYNEITALKRDVLPVAETAAEAARIGYQEGRFGLLQIIDAQRALAEGRARLIDAYATYHAALADAERLTGQPLRRLDRRASHQRGEKR